MPQLLRILIGDPSPDVRRAVKEAMTQRQLAEVVEVTTAAEIRAAVVDGGVFDAIFIDGSLPDEPGTKLTRWIRQDLKSPRPNIPIVLMSDNNSPGMKRAAIQAGGRFLPKPFNQGRLVIQGEEMLTAYPNFIVSPSYFGPDRRWEKQRAGADKRTAKSISVQIVDEPGDFTLEKETIVVVFDYLKLRLAGAARETFRDFLLRDHVTLASANIPVIQERLLGKITEEHGALDSNLAALQSSGSPSTLRNMNRSAKTIMVDTATAGFVLMSSLATSLHHYTSGTYDISDRLIRFLSVHVSAIRSAITYRIFDDGGNIGTTIVGELQIAEGAFKRSMA